MVFFPWPPLFDFILVTMIFYFVIREGINILIEFIKLQT